MTSTSLPGGPDCNSSSNNEIKALVEELLCVPQDAGLVDKCSKDDGTWNSAEDLSEITLET